MINSEKNIYIQETEVKPNRYASLVLCFTLGITLVCWLMNELDAFHVSKNVMRIGTGITVLTTVIPLVMLKLNPSFRQDPRTKFFILSAGIAFTMTTTTLMTFHTTIMLLFPISLAMLYRSKKLGNMAVVSSLFCTLTSSITGYLLGVWDVPLFQELISIANNGQVEVIGETSAIYLSSVVKIFLYLVFPKLMMVGSYALLMYYIIRLSEDHLSNQIQLHQVSHRDSLTGLYNQNYFKEIQQSRILKGPVGLIFFDVNGLKEANDTKGHEWGDLLLKRSAESILNILRNDRENAFRLGGDEFLLIMEGADDKALQRKLAEWKTELSLINQDNQSRYDGLICSVAAGCVTGDADDLAELVSRADALMYKNKLQMKKAQG